MSWTKRQIAFEAFKELGLASHEHDLSADEIMAAVRRLDMIVASWDIMGRKIGYPLPNSPEKTKAEAETNIPDWAALGLAAHLAISIAPQYGKNVSRETRHTAQSAMNSIYSYASAPDPRHSFPGMPYGAGNKTHVYGNATFVPDDLDTVTDKTDTEIEGL